MRCVSCGHTELTERKALLDTPLLTIFGLEGANRPARLLVCDNCSYVHWFLGKPGEPKGSTSLTDGIECLECKTFIPSDQDACPACGWTWKQRL